MQILYPRCCGIEFSKDQAWRVIRFATTRDENGGAALWRGMLETAAQGSFMSATIWCFEPVCELGWTLVGGTTQCGLLPPGGRARGGMSDFLGASTGPAAERCLLQILYSRCCGIDVHQDSVTACVLVYKDTVEPEVRKKEFATHKRALGNLRLWLHAKQVTQVAMESTGVYWKPVWQALEGNFELTLANPYQIKSMPGRKTDARDSQRIAELLAHGLIRRSFVPPRETRNLRDLTRYRVKLVEERNRIHNRIHKVLEDACIKLDTIASDILGVSGRRVIRAIIAGTEQPADLAYQVRGTLRGKRPQLTLALERTHHGSPPLSAARIAGRSGARRK